MARPLDTCVLSTFLAATWTKPEEQATAVLGSALQTSAAFQRAFLERIGIQHDGAIEMSTEEPTGLGRRRIDLQFRMLNARGGLARRAWIEVKVAAELSAAVEHDEDADEYRGQLVEYRAALDARDRARPELPSSLLALVVPSCSS
jgi:hypothetical protein